MTEEQAIAYVELHGQTAEYPVVSDEDVTAIVQRNMRAVVWTAETEYAIGDVVRPATRNAHFYCCVAAGTSGETEPTWNDEYHAKVSETDSDLVWQECAIDTNGNLYNTRAAIHEVWLLKAEKAANQFDVSMDGTSWKREQIHQNCLYMASAYAPVEF